MVKNHITPAITQYMARKPSIFRVMPRSSNVNQVKLPALRDSPPHGAWLKPPPAAWANSHKAAKSSTRATSMEK